MTNTSTTLLAAVLMMVFTVRVQAQGETFGGQFSNSGAGTTNSADRTGTAGAQYLLLPITAQSASLGTAATAGVESMTGLEALMANPASLMFNSGTNVMLSRMEYVADIGVNTFGIAQRFGVNNLALVITSWDIGDIPVQTEENPEITDLTFSPTFIQMGLSYARLFTDRIAAGVTTKLLSEQLDDMNATGVAFDAGMTYEAGESGLRFGVSLKNFGPQMNYGGDGLTREVRVPGQKPNAATNSLEIETVSFELPSLLNFGVSYTRQLGANMTGSVISNYRSNSFSKDEYSAGFELALQDVLAVRGGMQVQENQDEITFFRGWNLGAGLNLNVSGTRFILDYAFRGTQFFDDVHLFTANVTL